MLQVQFVNCKKIHEESYGRVLVSDLAILPRNGLKAPRRKCGGGSSSRDDTREDADFTKPAKERIAKNPAPQAFKDHKNLTPQSVFVSQFEFKEHQSNDMSIALPTIEFSGDFQELDEKLNSMMALGTNIIPDGPNKTVKATICKVCGKEDRRCNIKRHIESNHVEGISIPCSFCDKTFRSI